MIRAEDIKELRAETGVSISEIRRALEEADGDKARARGILERAMGERGGTKAARETGSGVIDCYLHPDRSIGVLVAVLCETDFVARTPEFRAFAHELAMHIAAMNPTYVQRGDVPEEVVADERRLIAEEAQKLGKAQAILDEIISGKLESHFKDISLLDQPFVKNPDKTVGEWMREAAGKFGENIKVSQFIRFALK